MKRYEKYKNSGVQWIGEVPSHWEIVPFKYYTDVIMGQSPNGEDIKSEGATPFMQGNAEFGNIFPSTIYFCEACSKFSRIGDILMSVRAPVGEINLSDKVYGIGRGLCSISAKHCNRQYLWYFLKKSKNDLNIYANGSTFTAITIQVLKSFKLILPPLPEQQAIASFLDTKTKPIDDIIAKREKQIELLEEMKSAIISRAVTKGLNPEAQMKDSGIEWIKTKPHSWETRRIKNVITLLTDYDANGSFADIAKNVKVNVGEPYAWMVRATDLANKRYGIVDDNNYCNKETFDFLSKSSLEAGDILIAKRGDIGKSYAVPKCDCPMTLAPNTYLLKTNKKVISNRFFHYFFMSDYGKKQLSINNKSTTIGAIYKDDVKNLKILLPPMDEQQAIASYLDTETSKIDIRIAKRRKQIELLQEYKQTLITAAVTGKIDVREHIS